MRLSSPFSSRIFVGLLTALLVVAAPVACRKPAKPSEAYTQAHTRFGKLYGEKGDDAFLDPELAQVESLLAQVPADSLDAVAAQELRARIQTGKQQAAARQKAQEDAMAKAREQGPSTGGFGSETGSPAPAPSDSEPVDEASDAGTEGADAGAGVPGVGTPEAQLASSGCFQKGEPLEVKGRGRRDRWELADRPACRQQYASLQDQVLIIEEGKVLAQVPRSAIQAIPADGGTGGPTPDAGR
ncbi:hypothetical protein ATI61_11941 [Archangium gephyra]|uniref:Uncharacterized protein n=1 Tax=Archangium gephyra TaxID=48 RepID=A0AAC8QAD3_9BACT|nr:hypothetical protein [Archangium gephyra]AKJ03710.1 Hypothetical protein AA314_05336 [Archangium gephyra]REG22511.1 hypothetical protein ATI61_11941 [Archangium gephyra]